MTVTKYNNMSNEQIISLIEDCVSSGLSHQEEICQHLKEMSRRNLRHKFHKHPLYKWFNEVADKKLLMGVVALFSGKKSYLEHLVGRPLDMQKTILAEIPLDVAQIDRKTGQIVDARKPALRLKLTDFQRVFPIGKPPATLKEQREALAAEMAAQPVTRTVHGPIIRAIKEEGVLMVGSTRVPLHLVSAALKEIGAQVTLPEMEN